MSLRYKVLVLSAAISMVVALGFGFSHIRAQQATTTKTTAPTPTPTPDEEVIKVDTEVVNVLFTAQDQRRRLLTDLKQEDIKILEDGKEQPISTFSRQIDLPLSLAILIDTSASQERTLPDEKSAAIQFLDSVVRPSKDEVSVISFTGESTLEQGMTNNLARLRRSIDSIHFVAPSGYIGGGVVVGTPPISGTNRDVTGSTAIWDAIWVTSDEVLGPAPDKTRRAIILLSDGVDTFSRKKLNDAVNAAIRSETIVYSIGIGDNFYSGVDRGSMTKIAERTGGRAFFPQDASDLRKAFEQIQLEMRSQYLLAYEPLNQNRDGSYRNIQIQVVNPQMQKDKVQLTHRQGYFARSAPVPPKK